MSAQIRVDRSKYFNILEKTQKGGLDVTDWVIWFLVCLINSLKSTNQLLVHVLAKNDFWSQHAHVGLNDRQKKILHHLLRHRHVLIWKDISFGIDEFWRNLLYRKHHHFVPELLPLLI